MKFKLLRLRCRIFVVLRKYKIRSADNHIAYKIGVNAPFC